MSHIDSYSRLIAWLKIALPLAALALLSTLFLVARTVNPEDAIPYAEVDVEDRLREPRMTQPTYAGLTEDGAALTLSAAEARPDKTNAGSGTLAALTGVLETPDGAQTKLEAGSARIEDRDRRLYFSGGVRLAQSNGWVVTTEEMTAQMDRTEIEARVPVQAEGPAGTLRADGMILREAEAIRGKYVLVFNGAVKLVYRPAD